jgi:hypothetical protein
MNGCEKKKKKNAYEAAEDAGRMLKQRLNLRRAGRGGQRGRCLVAEKDQSEDDI